MNQGLKQFCQNNPSIMQAKINNSRPWVVGVGGGWSYETAQLSNEIPEQYKDYYKDLKRGFHITADVSRFLTTKLGAGVRYSYFNSKNETSGPISYGSLSLSDDIKISSFNVIFCYRFLETKQKNFCYINCGPGLFTYSNYSVSGKTGGLVVDIGYDDVGKSKHLGFGFRFSYSLASINQINTGAKQGYVEQNISRLDLTALIKFYK
jgi:hypothetical protein